MDLTSEKPETAMTTEAPKMDQMMGTNSPDTNIDLSGIMKTPDVASTPPVEVTAEGLFDNEGKPTKNMQDLVNKITEEVGQLHDALEGRKIVQSGETAKGDTSTQPLMTEVHDEPLSLGSQPMAQTENLQTGLATPAFGEGVKTSIPVGEQLSPFSPTNETQESKPKDIMPFGGAPTGQETQSNQNTSMQGAVGAMPEQASNPFQPQTTDLKAA